MNIFKKNLTVFFLLFSLSAIAQNENDEKDISIDDVIAHLEKGNTDILENHAVILRSVHFESGTSTLLENDKIYLDSLSNYLKLIPTVELYVNGHTDNVGNSRKNLLLSKKRAKIVEEFLISKGIQPDQVHSGGYGDNLPIADNNTPEGRQANRRVELKFKPQEGSKAENENKKEQKKQSGTTSGSQSQLMASLITTNSGEQIPAEFFMFSHSGDTLIYKEKKSDKVVKKLRVPDIRSITLPGGINYDLAKRPSPEVVKINPTKPTTIKLNDGRQISAEYFKASQKGDSVIYYKENRADKTISKLHASEVDSITLSNGTKYGLKKTPVDPLPPDSNTAPVPNLFEKDTTPTVPFMRKVLTNIKRITSNTSPFGFIGRYPLKTKETTASLVLHNEVDTAVVEGIYRKAQGGCFAFALGLEYQNNSAYYARLAYNYGYSSQSTFHSFVAGVGKIFGGSGIRGGIDIASTTAFNKFASVNLSQPLSFGNVMYKGSVSPRFRNYAITLAPNVSFEYSSRNSLHRTVRFSFGVPVSIPVSSQIKLYGTDMNGSASHSSQSLKSSEVDFLIDAKKQKTYNLSSLMGWCITFGYVFK